MHFGKYNDKRLVKTNFTVACVRLSVVSAEERLKPASSEKWPEERSGEPVRIFFKHLSSPPTTSFSSRKTVPRVKISDVKMTKYAM